MMKNWRDGTNVIGDVLTWAFPPQQQGDLAISARPLGTLQVNISLYGPPSGHLLSTLPFACSSSLPVREDCGWIKEASAPSEEASTSDVLLQLIRG